VPRDKYPMEYRPKNTISMSCASHMVIFPGGPTRKVFASSIWAFIKYGVDNGIAPMCSYISFLNNFDVRAVCAIQLVTLKGADEPILHPPVLLQRKPQSEHLVFKLSDLRLVRGDLLFLRGDHVFECTNSCR